MTILTKPSLIIRKADVTEAPLVHENLCDEEKIDIQPAVAWTPSRPSGGLVCMSLTALLMATVGIVCGLLLYRQYLHTNAVHRYQGFCSIPMDDNEEARWGPDPDMAMFAAITNKKKDNMLVEKFDIGDDYEKVLVIDNGRNFEFIHDFNVNLTGIVDEARCFMMSMEPSLVLPPERLVAGIESGSRPDVTRVRSALRADVNPPPPALLAAAMMLMDACLDKPIYMLKSDDSLLIRKRSAEEPPHEFIQFSGNHVQEIAIGNMDEILAYEKTQGLKQASALAPEDSQVAPERAPLALPLQSHNP